MSLDEYKQKRDFRRTPEPEGKTPAASNPRGGRFYIQRHYATRLHYDLRLEINGVLKSWAVPKGPSLDATEKPLAMMTEDHPLEYGTFEGIIPEGNYGAGRITVWDQGTYEVIGEPDAAGQLERGDFKFRLHGTLLNGLFAIVRMKGRGKGNEWLLIKKKDEYSKPGWYPFLGIPGAVEAPMPGFFSPMAAEMADAPPKAADWLYEIKWDGVRALCFIEPQGYSLYTRNNNRCEQNYPELNILPEQITAARAILDGELAVLDERGVSHFELIQPRIHSKEAAGAGKPVHYFAFDLLYLDGFDLRGAPLVERKKLLKQILQPHPLLRISEHFEDGTAMLKAAKANGLEGLIAKRAGSIYESRRSRNWLKLKLTSEQEFVIGGYLPGERDYFGSLAVGFHEAGKLHYAGNVGTGFDETTRKALWLQLETRTAKLSPFDVAEKMPKGMVWVKPELVAQVKFANWTSDRKLRAPVYIGLRGDKPPQQVKQEKSPVHFSNLKKLYYPDDGYTKGDVVAYYQAVAPLLLPHLKDRPLSLKRYPDGIHGEFFFQKNTPESYPKWLPTETIDGIRYIIAQNEAVLLYLANLGCIDQNPWMSRIGSLDCPDFLLIDLDPQECNYDKIVEAALLIRTKLTAIGLTGYPKTTGGDGMHIYVPLEPHYSYDIVRGFAEVIARLVATERPDLFTTPRSVAAREKNRVYFDYLQIAQSKTISAPYVARAYKGAPVSTPLEWSEVRPGLRPEHFNIINGPQRFAANGDLFEGVLRKPQTLETAFAKLDKLLRG